MEERDATSTAGLEVQNSGIPSGAICFDYCFTSDNIRTMIGKTVTGGKTEAAGERGELVALLLKVACPGCGQPHDFVPLGAEVRCPKCGRDYRAQGDGEGASRIISVTPDEMDAIPYSQRSVEVPVNSVSSLIVADPALLYDKLLRDTPLRENTRWVGKVRLIKKLGQGGMGAVYRGYDESLALDVAVKVLPLPSGARDDQFVQRFRQEARISAQINHPNVVRTLHVDEQGDLIYLVMDYVEGQTARTLVESKGPLMLPLALQIIHDASLGMEAAHARGVIHRDIKPDNILLADDGRVLLSDLGLAKAITTGGRSPRMPVTRLGLLLGTPEYMSPEQWDIGAEIGPAADIWAMGAALWMLLTRKPPFDEKDTGLLARMVKEAPLPDIREARPNLPDSVLDILYRCLEKKPERRFADSSELIRALNEALDDLAAGRARITPRPRPRPRAITPAGGAPAEATARKAQAEQARTAPSAAPPAAEKPRPRRPVLWAAAAALVSAAAFWGVLSYQSQRAHAPAPAAARAVALDLRYPAHIKPGQEAELRADVTGADPGRYAVVWFSGQSAYTGSTVHVPLDNDRDFTVTVRDKNTGREVTRRDVRVSVDVQVLAAENDFQEIVSGSPLKFTGFVQGGAGPDAVETRWVEQTKPDAVLATGTVLNLPETSAFQQPGRYAFVLQARRRSGADWAAAASCRMVVQVVRRVPEEFKAAVQEGTAARQRALQAATGAEAAAAWKQALNAFERACGTFADDEAKLLAEQCRQRVGLEEKYLSLLQEAQRLKGVAEAAGEADGLRRLAAWTEALRPAAAAAVLCDRDEARALARAAEAKVNALKAVLETAADERTAYERLITKARHAAKEARKYVDPAVALPHWEEALAGFAELGKQFPARAEESALELKEVRENRDQAYLRSTLGVVPARPPEKGQPASQPKAANRK